MECDIRVVIGTTSACAENTSFPRQIQTDSRNYLRVRGEYSSQVGRRNDPKELPPRARRIQSATWSG